jgi:hypothetical protein
MAGGDFNSKHTNWGSRLTTAKGREIYVTVIDNNYSCISTGHPTYWPSDTKKKNPDLLDFFITKYICPSYVNTTAS